MSHKAFHSFKEETRVSNREMGDGMFFLPKREHHERKVEQYDNDILRVTSIYERRFLALLSDRKNVATEMATFRERRISTEGFSTSDYCATRLIGRNEK